MTVPVSQRSESDLKVFTDALDLISYTTHVLSNKKNFNPQYKQLLNELKESNPEDFNTNLIKLLSNIDSFNPVYENLINRMLDCVIECGLKIWEADHIYCKTYEDYEKRVNLQKEALIKLNLFEYLIIASRATFHIKGSTMNTWGDKILELRSSMKNWREADSKRFINLLS